MVVGVTLATASSQSASLPEGKPVSMVLRMPELDTEPEGDATVDATQETDIKLSGGRSGLGRSTALRTDQDSRGDSVGPAAMTKPEPKVASLPPQTLPLQLMANNMFLGLVVVFVGVVVALVVHLRAIVHYVTKDVAWPWDVVTPKVVNVADLEVLPPGRKHH